MASGVKGQYDASNQIPNSGFESKGSYKAVYPQSGFYFACLVIMAVGIVLAINFPSSPYLLGVGITLSSAGAIPFIAMPVVFIINNCLEYRSAKAHAIQHPIQSI